MRASDPPRRPGRPKAAERSVKISTWIPARTFDELARYALKHDRSLSALLRDSLTRIVTPRPPHKPG